MDRDIRFEHVNFAYEGVQPVLQDIDFTIPAGSTFAILGATGSGKSTLVHLLDRLYDLPPESGRITIGGIDISKIRRGLFAPEYRARAAGTVPFFPHNPGKYPCAAARCPFGGGSPCRADCLCG